MKAEIEKRISELQLKLDEAYKVNSDAQNVLSKTSADIIALQAVITELKKLVEQN